MKRKIFLPILIIFLSFIAVPAQNIKAERILHQEILKNIKKDIEKHYYDKDLRGVDIEKNYKKAGSLIESAKTVEEMTDIITRFLYPFEDSHVYYVPPPRTVEVDYGWDLRMVGDKTFVFWLDEQSDAYQKGVRVGDQIYMIEGYIPNRKEFSMLRHHFEVLSPRESLNILLIKPSGNKYKVNIKAKIIRHSVFKPSTRQLRLRAQKEFAEETRYYLHDEIEGLSILRMKSFGLTPTSVDKMIGKVKKTDALILDLRGNGGGLLVSLGRLISHLFDKNVIIGREIEREKQREIYVEPHSKKNFGGKIVVLIDSDSASAAEILARIIQIEKRGKVLGDQSAGAVMRSQIFFRTYGLDTRIPYGVSITTANLLMRDGKELENVGVTPDEKILPSAMDLAKNRDPVLSRAAEILGFQITPEEAGKIFDEQ